MIKTLCWGGLGDAAMAWAKLHSAKIPVVNFVHTHVEVHDILLPAIREFYASQNMCYDVFKISGQEEFDRIKGNYDTIIETGWKGEPWDIHPFFHFKTNESYKYDMVINISAGRNESRKFLYKDIREFIYKVRKNFSIVLVGQYPYPAAFDNLKVTNLLNKTSIQSLIDILVSTPMFIGHPGFCCYVSAMSRNRIFTTSEPNWQKRFHPNWYVTFIKYLEEVKFE